MVEFRGERVSDVWAPILRYILDEGVERHTIHNNAWFTEVAEPIMAVIRSPQKGRIPDGFNWTDKTLKMYADQILDKDDHGFVYTYGSRIGRNNQIEHIIRKLEEDPNTKQAMATTWDIIADNESSNPPCLQLVDFKIYNNKLHLTAYFRSNDMYAAWVANAYLLTELMHYISIRAIGHSNLGSLTIVSNGAHIYQYAIQDARRIVYDSHYKDAY
jgi:thymidylate synthase